MSRASDAAVSVSPRERRGARQHLVEQEPDRVEVRAGVDRLARELLGREVASGADDRSGLG